MKKTGIIVEYNPFHNGHKYHLEKARENDNLIIAVMSGDFVQRGEPSFINKWDKAKSCIYEGIDILVELPVFYSTQSAEIFARGAIGILDYLEANQIIFGSETDNIEKLTKILSLEKNKEFNEALKKNLKSGVSYPTAYNNEIEKFLGKNYSLNPNDILGLEYLRAINFWNSSIVPNTLKREGASYHSNELKNQIASATGIRKFIFENIDDILKLKSIENFMPKQSSKIILKKIKNKEITNVADFYFLIRYAIISQKEKLKDIQDVEDGFENRLYEKALKYENYSEFLNEVITKRYTIGRIQRILLHVLLGITKNVTKNVKKEIPFIKILGFSKAGQLHLKNLKKKQKTKILTSLKNVQKNLSEEERKLLELNENASKIYGIINPYINQNIPIIY